MCSDLHTIHRSKRIAGDKPPAPLRAFKYAYVSQSTAKVMKIFEILSFNREILDRLDRLGIHPDDHKHLDLYNDYRTMKARGEKVTYIVAILAERYAVSERKVYNLIARLGKDCTEHAAIPPPK